MLKVSVRGNLFLLLSVFFLLATLFPEVVFANLPSSRDAFNSAESDVVFVDENCESFKEGECISFEDFKEKEEKSLIGMLVLLKRYLLQVEGDITVHQENINLISAVARKHNTVELEEIQHHLKQKLALEKELLVITEEQLFLLKELIMACEEALNFLQKEITETNHLPFWQERRDVLSVIVEIFWQKIKKSTEARGKVSID
jgi:hypothetical protein